jgi:hypothetical protein
MVFGLKDDATSDVIDSKLCGWSTVRREKLNLHHTTNAHRTLAEKCMINVGWK